LAPPDIFERKQVSKKIRIAHFAAFCPNRTGQYATVKDMIKAERSAGIDAQFITTSVDAKKIAQHQGIKEDGWLRTMKPEWARSADILMRHSCIPDEFTTLGIPIMMALHGRPESTFIIEFVDLMKVYRLLALIRDDPRYKGFITFWKSHEFFHQQKVPKDKVYYVPAMVDLDEYNPEGKAMGIKKVNGSPNIIVADMWRHDMTPYSVLYAAALFREKYCPTARAHVFGVPDKKCDSLMLTMKNNGLLGAKMGLCWPMANVYRGGDLLITPHNIATRVVREALACGLPIVAGSSNPFTEFKADPRDIESFAEQIERCWQHIKAAPDVTKKQCRELAEREFNTDRAGEAILLAVEDVLRKEQKRWKKKGKKHKIYQKTYEKYGHYHKHQASKMQGGYFSVGKDYQTKYRISLGRRLNYYINYDRIKPGQNVLCLGARDGTEVQAFLDKGFFAVGMDLLPKSEHFVLKGDFQKIPYPNNCLDIVFTNSIDHTSDIDKFLSEIQRVLKPMGAFIADFGPAISTYHDRFASCRWKNFEDIKEYIREKGYAVECVQSFIDGYFVNSVCFRSLGGVNRSDIINAFIEKYNYKSYLEIGSNLNETFDVINCKSKVSVDPEYKPMFKMTSDEYFAQTNGETFDIIFIDGLHAAEQVLKDVNNALKHLNPEGRIIMHDCNPRREFLQYDEKHKEDEDKTWCGDVWKAFAQIRMTRDDLSAYVINRDYGVGVLKKDGQTIWKEHIPMEELTWSYLVKNRRELLRLQEPPKWMEKINAP
jgi:SAM-dependent methyltransferase